MLIQVLSDLTITIRDPSSHYVLGCGEMLTLPARLAVKVLLRAPNHFRIMHPVPLIPGVSVRWLLLDDREQGPSTVAQLDGDPPNRRVLVLNDGELRCIDERDITDVDPWPAIDAKLDEALDHVIREGEESSQLAEFKEWFLANFGENDELRQ